MLFCIYHKKNKSGIYSFLLLKRS